MVPYQKSAQIKIVSTFETKMNEKVCLQWNDFRDDLHTAITNLRKDTDFTDVTLVCEDGSKV